VVLSSIIHHRQNPLELGLIIVIYIYIFSLTFLEILRDLTGNILNRYTLLLENIILYLVSILLLMSMERDYENVSERPHPTGLLSTPLMIYAYGVQMEY
jgi:hypothetical protein